MKHMIDDIEIYQDWKPKEDGLVKVVREKPLADPESFGLTIDAGPKTVQINSRGKLVTCQAVYSILLDAWRNGPMIAHHFPICAISPVLFEMQEGWKITNPELLAFERGKPEETGLLNNDP